MCSQKISQGSALQTFRSRSCGPPRCRIARAPILLPVRPCLNDTVIIKIGNQYVKQAKYVKFLGLLLDENLSWMYHLSELNKKLSRTCGIFFKVRHLLPTTVLISLYNSLFSSFLQYGVIVWGLTYDTHIKPIYLLQKKVVRAIAFKSFRSPSTSIFLI